MIRFTSLFENKPPCVGYYTGKEITMKFYFDKHDGTSKELSMDELREHMSEYNIHEAKEAKKRDPLEEVSYMTVGGFIRVEL